MQLLSDPCLLKLQNTFTSKPKDLGTWNFERMFTCHDVSTCPVSDVRYKLSGVKFKTKIYITTIIIVFFFVFFMNRGLTEENNQLDIISPIGFSNPQWGLVICFWLCVTRIIHPQSPIGYNMSNFRLVICFLTLRYQTRLSPIGYNMTNWGYIKKSPIEFNMPNWGYFL